MVRKKIKKVEKPSWERPRTPKGTFQPQGEPINKVLSVRVSESVLGFLNALPSKQDWIREAIAEKMAREQE